MTRALLTRLKKLEAKRRTRRVHRPIIFACYAEEGGGDILALSMGAARVVNRLFTDQCMTAFAYRAASVLGGARIMFAVHAEPEPSSAPHGAPSPAVEPDGVAGSAELPSANFAT